MQHPGSRSAEARRRNRLLPPIALALTISMGAPALGSADERGDLRGLIRDFNLICVELQAARADLQHQILDERGFGDRILELFVRADSLTELLETRIPAPRRGVGQGFALEWALKHLRQSLRENYEGIVEKDGYRFVTADMALRAAEAWQGKLADPVLSLP